MKINLKKHLALSTALIMTAAVPVSALAEETGEVTVITEETEADAENAAEEIELNAADSEESESDTVTAPENTGSPETGDAAETESDAPMESADPETINVPVTRLDVAETLYGLAGETETDNAAPFSDTDAPAVTWLYENGIAAGFEDGTFRPDANVTREQLAMFIYNYMSATGHDVSNIEGMGIYEFTDYNHISEWALTAVRYCLNAGLIPTGPGAAYGPQDTVTTAELSSLVNTISAM